MRKAKLTIGRKIKLCMAVCAAAVMMCSVIPVSAASGEYDVIFRAGSKGNFGNEDIKSFEYPNAQYGSTIADNGGIPKVENIKDGYYQTGWSPELTEGTVVTKRQVYVAQYVRITDKAEYRVNYVDTEGMPIATQKVDYTQKGAEVTENALPIDGYTPDEESKTLRVSDEEKEITFTYTAGQNVVNETETQTETTVVPGTTTTTTTPGAAGTAATTPAAGAAGTAGAGTATEDQGTTTINDEEVPLAQNPAGDGEDAQDTETLEDEEVPKADKDLEKMSPWAYVGMAAAVIALAGIVVLVIRKKKMN